MPIDKTKFSKWLRLCLYQEGVGGLRCIELRHEGPNDLVRRWMGDDFIIEPRVCAMIDEAERHARHAGGRQRYKFSVFFGEDIESAQRFVCHYNFPTDEDEESGNDDDDDDDDNEPDDECDSEGGNTDKNVLLIQKAARDLSDRQRSALIELFLTFRDD